MSHWEVCASQVARARRLNKGFMDSESLVEVPCQAGRGMIRQPVVLHERHGAWTVA